MITIIIIIIIVIIIIVIIIIYGKGKKCWSNVNTNFSDSLIWPGKWKDEMKYKLIWEVNTIEN